MLFEGYTVHFELDLYPAGSLLRESPTLAAQLRRPKNLAEWISSQHRSGTIIECHIFLQHVVEMSFIQDEDVV